MGWFAVDCWDFWGFEMFANVKCCVLGCCNLDFWCLFCVVINTGTDVWGESYLLVDEGSIAGVP